MTNDNDGEIRYTDEFNSQPEKAKPWILTADGRRYLYAVAAAVLVVVAGYLGLDAAQRESILSLVGAVLNIGGAAATTYAITKTTDAS